MRAQRKKYLVVLLGFFFACFLAGVSFVWRNLCSASKNAILVGIVDGEKIWRDLPVIKNLKGKLNTQLQNHHRKFSDVEAELRRENQALIAMHQSIESGQRTQKTEFEKRQKAFSEKLLSVQKSAEAAQRDVNFWYESSIKNVQNKIQETIKKVAQRKKISLVIYQNQAPYFEKMLDITDDVFAVLQNEVTFSFKES